MTLTLRRALLLAALSPLVFAAGASADSKPAGVVLSVGSTYVTLGELQREIATVPYFQLASLGKSDPEIRRAYAQQVVVPRLLMAEDARTRKLSDTLAVKQLGDRALVQALEESVRSEASAEVTDAAVKQYFDEHRAELAQPERIRVFRLLVADRAEAQKLLEKARQVKDMSAWRTLVRDHSLDQATRMRGGDLGFVHPNGDTDVPSMALTKKSGGHTVAVYHPNGKGRDTCVKLLHAGRADFIAAADYRAGSRLSARVKLLLDAIVAGIAYRREAFRCLAENRARA